MRLLYLADRLSERGGADWHLCGLLRSLAERHELLLAAGQADGRARAPCSFALVDGLAARERSPVDLAPLCEAFRPELLHLQNVMNPAVLEWAIASSVPVVATVQDHRVFCPGRGKWTASGQPCREPMSRARCSGCFTDEGYFETMLTLTAERLAALRRMELVVLSRYMRDELVTAGVSAERIHVIAPFVHGLDPEAAADGAPCMLFLGRLVEAKGVRDAVEIWRASALPLPLVFAGSGPLRPLLEAHGATVLGWVPHERLSPLIRRARVLLMPSRWQEPFGIAGLEALSLGVPVAAWRSGGIAEWHPGEGLVDWGDVPGLARAAASLASRPLARSYRFEPEARIEQLVALYRRLLGQSPAAG